MDEETHNALSCMKLSNMKLIRLQDFENRDEMLQEAKKNRSRIEYYFTCTPSLPLFIFKNFSEVDLIAYIDADVYFFNDPSEIYKEMSNHSISIVKHSFSHQNIKNTMHGIYNVGWVSFRRDENAMECLNWWRQMCNEWCYDRVEKGRFADQGYLDIWSTRFKKVLVLQNKGINLAPWNIANYKICADKKNIWIDGELLIFFHFHRLRHLVWRLYSAGLGYYKTEMNKTMRRFIYKPYLMALSDAKKDLSQRFDNLGYSKSIRDQHSVFMLDKIYTGIKQFLYAVYHIIIFKDYVVASKD